MRIENGNLQGLEWLVDEIEVSLRQAFEALDAYLKDPSDEPQIRFCQGYIHQVHGTLKIAECHGALLLAEEMEELVEAVLQNSVASATEASEVLVQAILKLPAYIRQIVSTGMDQPAALISLLNDLRAVRGRPLLSEGSLFSPNLDSLNDKATSVRSSLLPDNDAFIELVKKLRQMYQMSLLGLIRNSDRDKNLSYIEKVFTRLFELSKGTVQNQLWRVALAVHEGIVHHSIQLSSAVKSLLRALDREIRRLQQYGVASLQGEIPTTLLKNLLYYVAHSNGNTVRILEVNEAFRLGAALPTGTFSGDSALTPVLDPGTVKAIATTLVDELGIAKELAIRYQQEGCLDGSLIDELDGVIGRMSDTLAFIGQSALSQPLSELREQIRADINEQGKLSEERQQAIATQLVDAESALVRWTSTGNIEVDDADQVNVELSRAQDSLLRETRNGLEKVKESIVEYISSQWDSHFLERSPNMLAEIHGALLMMSLERAAAVLDAARSYIEDQLLTGGAIPDWATLDHLADAITSIEYYLEARGERGEDESGAILTAAEKSAKALLGNTAISAEESSDSGMEILDNSEHLVSATDLPSVEAKVPDAAEAPAESGIGPLSAELPDTFVDQELVEVFVEEAAEVLENIGELLPKWTADVTDKEALTEVRRGFHTLKGSGRMVGADRIGELAWSIEYLLNQSIDGRVPTTTRITDLVATACEQLPTLIDHFKDRQSEQDRTQVDRLIAEAEALSSARSDDVEQSPALGESEAVDVVVGIKQETGAEDWDINAGDASTEAIDLDSGIGQNEEVSLSEPETESVNTESDNPEEPAQQVGVDSHKQLEQHVSETEVFDPEFDPKKEALLEHPERVEDHIEEHASLQLTADKAVTENKSLPEEPFLVETPVAEEPAQEPFSEEESLLEIFAEEARSHLEEIAAFLAECEREAPIYPPPTSAMQRALHTLKGSSNMACVEPVAELVGPLEYLVKELFNFQVPGDDELIDLLKDCSVALSRHLSALESQTTPELPELPELLARISALRDRVVTPLLVGEETDNESAPPADPRDLLGLMATGMQAILNAQQSLVEWRDGGERPDFEPLLPELDELSRAASKAGMEALALLASRLGDTFEVVGFSMAGQDQALAVSLEIAYDKLLEMIDCVAADQQLPAADPQLKELDSLIDQLLVAAEQAKAQEQSLAANEPETLEGLVEEAPQEEQNTVATDAHDGPQEELTDDVALPKAQAPAADVDTFAEQPQSPILEDVADIETSSVADVPAQDGTEEIDPEILGIFLEEAEELLENIDKAIHAWQEAPEDQDFAEQLKRGLHTFKGGARMAGLTAVGETSHNFESWLIESAQQAESDTSFFVSLLKWQDDLLAQVQRVRSASVDVTLAQQPSHPQRTAPQPSDSAAQVITELNNVVVRPVQAGLALANDSKAKTEPQEMVRVSAALLDDLVNMVGETSISRGRIEQQINEFGFALEEMDTTIRRLQDQVRRLGIETEAQVMFRREQLEASSTAEGFDPLEMDRYSQLQQLSRALMESASDLQDLAGTLNQKSKDTESLLVQQGRINTDIQEGLMRSRMVPFSRLVPRLRRIVRQVSNELEKDVELKLLNVEGEMDRSVLEKMLPALEHMLRNAIDHGIENGDERLAAGKPKQGVISIDLSREGGEILIRLMDDGRGLNISAIRKQAVRRGLMVQDVLLSDQEIVQFILEPGFSTSEKVSQISGRGVGMDVVNADVRQLGGSIAIRSEEGVGTEFQVRLPFTVSINRALMIEVGEDLYALPLSSIDGVVRLSPTELEHFYRNPDASYKYGGSEYGIRYLGSLLHEGVPPRISAEQGTVPLVLVRSEQRSYAVQVDRLVGSSEIVVKTLGTQFSVVPGLSGATVLGDGRVVVILDLLALLRTQRSLPGTTVQWLEDATAADSEATVPTIMVVDDSVTVRKVTSRFLEREGFHVLTAKDGADAMRLLREHDPDVMLLDIEMPRMDGFEVASRLRSMARFQDMPIIMITSRTGAKHRERALSLGVNHYLGKPYREEDLLRAIEELRAETVE